MSKIAVIGEGVIDRFVQDGKHKDVIGGSGLNTAVAARRAGADVNWFTRLSSDENGQALTSYALAEGVLSPAPVIGNEPASLVKVFLQSDGQPRYEFALDGSVDWMWSQSELSDLANYELIQIGSLSAVLEPGSSLILQKLQQLKDSPKPPLITYDPNARPSIAKDESESNRVRNQILKFVALSDLVKVSDEDLTWITPSSSPTETAKDWSLKGPTLVVMTQGAEGATAFVNGKEVVSIPGISIQVVDTVGAGDTFMAWLIAQIANQYSGVIPTEIAKLTSLLSVAAKAAAITCSREGCKPPNRSEVD